MQDASYVQVWLSLAEFHVVAFREMAREENDNFSSESCDLANLVLVSVLCSGPSNVDTMATVHAVHAGPGRGEEPRTPGPRICVEMSQR